MVTFKGSAPAGMRLPAIMTANVVMDSLLRRYIKAVADSSTSSSEISATTSSSLGRTQLPSASASLGPRGCLRNWDSSRTKSAGTASTRGKDENSLTARQAVKCRTIREGSMSNSERSFERSFSQNDCDARPNR